MDEDAGVGTGDGLDATCFGAAGAAGTAGAPVEGFAAEGFNGAGPAGAGFAAADAVDTGFPGDDWPADVGAGATGA